MSCESQAPLLERPVRGDPKGLVLISGCDDAEEELSTGVVHRSEADLVELCRQLNLGDP